MKVLVDTSVWADFLNGHPSPEAGLLAALIRGDEDVCTCGIVAAEVFQGLRVDATRQGIEQVFRELTFVEARSIDTYLRAAEIHRKLRRQGKTVRSTIDCVLAALAEEHACYVLARDRDMDVILGSGFVQARRLTGQ